jgi:nitrogen regulatory protein PII
MTKIEAVVREQRLGAVIERLELLGVQPLSVYAVRCSGAGEGRRIHVRGRSVSLAFVRKVMLEWCGPDDEVNAVVRAIRHCADDGEPGSCTIFLQNTTEPVSEPVECRGQGIRTARRTGFGAYADAPLARTS